MVTRSKRAPAQTVAGEQLPPGQNWAAHDETGTALTRLPPDDDADGDDDEYDDDEQGPLERVLVALAEEADPSQRSRLALYRLVEKPGKAPVWEWCSDYTPADLEAGGLQMLRDQWGSGEYEMRVMGHKNGARHFTRIKTSRLVLAKPTAGALVPAGVTPVHAAPMAQQSSDLTAVLTMLAEGQQRLLEAVTQRPDPAAQMQQTFALIGAMRDAFGMKNPTDAAPQKSSIGEIVEAIKELKGVNELLGGSEGEQSETDKLIGMVTPLVQLVGQQVQQQPAVALPSVQPPQSFGVRNARPHPYVAALPATAAPSPVPSLPAQSPATGDAQAPSTPVDQPATSQGEDQQAALAELRGYLTQLVQLAAAGAPHEQGAELVYEKLPDEMFELLDMPIWWQALQQYAPEVAPHGAWFAAVRGIVFQWLDEDAEAPGDDDGGVQAPAAESSVPPPSPAAG